MSSNTTLYALKLNLVTSEDGSRYYKATTKFGDRIYTAIGVSPQDAREALLNELLAVSKADGLIELDPPLPPRPELSEVVTLVVLWGVLAFVVCGLFAIVAKILTN